MNAPSVNGGPPVLALGEMTWPEVLEARQHASVALLPLGACEQHGPAMALQTDTVRAVEVARRVARATHPRVVLTPAVPFGMSEHHMAFPGTVTLSSDTLRAVIVDVVRSLYRHGWRKVFLLTGHGGNNATMGVAVDQLRAELPDLHLASSGVTPLAADVLRTLELSDVRGHSCEVETSQSLYLDPSLVRSDLLRRGSASRGDLDAAGQLSRSDPGIRFPQAYDRLSTLGSLGDATHASAEIGRQVVERIVERLVAFLDAFAELPDRIPSTAIQDGPVQHSPMEEIR